MEVGSGSQWSSVAEVGGGTQRRSAEVGSGGQRRSVSDVGGGRERRSMKVIAEVDGDW